MPIVSNKFDSSNKFYKSHTPFQVPSNILLTSQLKDVISVNYSEPTESIKINQIYGAENRYSFTMDIENITTNLTLMIEILHGDFFIISTVNKFNLVPRQQQKIDVIVNNDFLNSFANTSNTKTKFEILVKNTTNDIGYIPLDIAPISKIQFESNITIE